jgi:amidase
VLDAALFLDALAGPAEGDAHVPPPPERSFADAARAEPRPLRIAVSLKPILPTKPGAAQRAAVEETAGLLTSLGHEVAERDPDYPELRLLVIPRYLRGVYLDAQRLEDPEALERRSRGMIRFGRHMGGLAERGRAKEEAAAARINAIFDDHDVLLMPVTASAAPQVGRDAKRGPLRTFYSGTDWVCYTATWNYTGQPAASVPVGLDEDGFPTAVQIVAPPNDEATLLSLAAQLETARPWADRHPPLGDDAVLPH